MARDPKPPSASFTEMTQHVLLQHANSIGTAFGGTILAWVDICGSITAQRHAGPEAVTARVDTLEFLLPIRIGDIVRLTGTVNAAFRTSMEIAVRVEREDARTGERTLCVSSQLTFVHLGEDGRPAEVPPLLLDTEESKERDAAARARREARRQTKN